MTGMTLSRRTLLSGTAALLAAGVAGIRLGTSAMAAPVAEGVIAHPPMWAAGTPGEYDWHAFIAESAEDAYAQMCSKRGIPRLEWPVFNADYVMRVPVWDGLQPDDLKPADWIHGGLGHFCQRCDCETAADCGGNVVNDEVVCEDCMGHADRLAVDPEYGYESLVEAIAVDGPEKTKAKIERDEDFSMIPSEIWLKAVAEAATLV